MKAIFKIFIVVLCLIYITPSFAVNFGYYKSDYEYGIFDSIKFNWKNRSEGKKFIELRTETKEGQEYLNQETKRYESNKLDENEQYKLIRDNTVAF